MDDSESSAAPNTIDKRLTFRARRLSIPKHHLAGDDDDDDEVNAAATAAAVANDDKAVIASAAAFAAAATKFDAMDTDDKAHTFRKRRLSLTLSKLTHDDEDDDAAAAATNSATDYNNDVAPRPPQRRRSSAASAASNGSAHSGSTATTTATVQLIFQSRTVHATELLNATDPPPSPAVHNAFLYLQDTRPLPPTLTLPCAVFTGFAGGNGNGSNGSGVGGVSMNTLHATQPRWKQSHAVGRQGDEHKLPFPRDIVGSYSCHGVEPIYDSGYEDNDDDEEWNETGKPGASATQKAQDQMTLPNKPTSAAKINQDRGGIAFPYGNSAQTALFAVYDGHGLGGEMVSQFALHEIQHRLEKHPHFRKDLVKAFKETFLAVDHALKNEPLIEPVFAGTTACVALLIGDTLTIGNAGDSRAVVANRNPSNHSLTAINLTVDQNPDLPEEMERILESGGFVSPPPAPGLSARVWLDPNFTQIGLAMARSIGDHAVASVGVIAEPVVTKHTVGQGDEFLILASDGVWEFISSQEAVDIVGEHLDRGATKACQALIESAAAKWHEEEGDYRDDITALVVCLQDLWDNDC